MNWKSTIVLAVLAGISFVAWLVLQPREEASTIREKPFDQWRESAFRRIAFRAGETPEIALKRLQEPVGGSVWHFEKPAKAAEDGRVAEMIAALRRLARDRSIKPGDADYTPSTYGFDKPVATVTVEAGDVTRTVKFGIPSSRFPNTRFFMIEGDQEIYLGPIDAVDPFQKAAVDLPRSRIFVAIDPARVVGIESSRRYLKAGADGKPGLKPEYEKLKFAYKDSAAGRKSWFLVGFNQETRDDPADGVPHLITGVRDLRAEEYKPITNPGDFGFEEPEFSVTFDVLQPPSNATKPLKVEFGKTVDKEDRRLIYVRVDGGDEAALISTAAFERLRKERKLFIPLQLLDFDADLLQTLELASYTGHRVIIEKGEESTRGTVTWIVKEPAGLPVDPAALSQFMEFLARSQFTEILGEQPDLKTFGLDKPVLTMTLRGKGKSGESIQRVYQMGRPGNFKDNKNGYVLKATGKDVFQLSEEVWRRLERADLNFRTLEMFNTTVDAIVELSFNYIQDHLGQQVSYTVRKGEGGKWSFVNGNADAKIDPDRITGILGAANHIKAEAFITRDPMGAKELELLDRSPGRMVIRYADPRQPGKSAEVAFRISKSHGDSAGRTKLYYAKIEPAPGNDSPSSDSTIVFRIKTEVVETFRNGPYLQDRPLPEK